MLYPFGNGGCQRVDYLLYIFALYLFIFQVCVSLDARLSVSLKIFPSVCLHVCLCVCLVLSLD